MKNLSKFFTRYVTFLALLPLSIQADQKFSILKTIADANSSPAVYIDLGAPGSSLGDQYIFDQPLLNDQGEAIGSNSGFCLRTKKSHSLQCQWTLTLDNGTIQVAGREFDRGESFIPIVGGTGKYATITGYMRSSIMQDGRFQQILHYRLL